MNTSKLFTLAFLLILQLPFSLKGQATDPAPPDSVKVPIAAIYFYNSVLDSLGACQEDHQLLVNSAKEAEISIAQRDNAIWLLKYDIVEYGILDKNNQEIIREKNLQLQKANRKKWITGFFGALVGAFVYSVAK